MSFAVYERLLAWLQSRSASELGAVVQLRSTDSSWWWERNDQVQVSIL